MNALPEPQLRDALAYMSALNDEKIGLAQEPKWGEGLRLWLPNVIALSPDYKGEEPVAWLIANDFGGYDLTTSAPGKI